MHKIPTRPFHEILQAFYVEDKSERVRAQGTITYYQPGSAIVVQDGEKALWVDTLSEEPHSIGEEVIVSGLPDVRNGSVVLDRGEIESLQWRQGEKAGEGVEEILANMSGVDVPAYHRERPGISAFAIEGKTVYHTYSAYARGVDAIWAMYPWLDRAPKGRNESGVWWKRHDEYDGQ